MALRFAILHHTGIPQPHYDLMFETFAGSDLATWRAETWPVAGRTVVRRLKDHRRTYLDYEGEVSQRRGHVERVAGGTCTVEIAEDAVWTIRLQSGGPPLTLRLHPVDESSWEAEPI